MMSSLADFQTLGVGAFGTWLPMHRGCLSGLGSSLCFNFYPDFGAG